MVTSDSRSRVPDESGAWDAPGATSCYLKDLYTGAVKLNSKGHERFGAKLRSIGVCPNEPMTEGEFILAVARAERAKLIQAFELNGIEFPAGLISKYPLDRKLTKTDTNR